MKTKMMNVDKLLPADYNPRVDLQEGDEEFEKLKAVIEKYGFVQPIVLNTRTGNIVGGHQRQKVAKSLGMDKVPVVEVDLDPTEEKTLNLALNKVGGSFDEEKLGQLLNELKVSDTDLNLTGFDAIEIEELTLAFDDTDFSMEDLNDFDDEPSSDDDEDPESFDEEDVPQDERPFTVQYNIVFDDEIQQKVFHDFLRKLKADYDNDAFPTIASRLHAYLMKEVFNGDES
jgi:hypothetical protein